MGAWKQKIIDKCSFLYAINLEPEIEKILLIITT